MAGGTGAHLGLRARQRLRRAGPRGWPGYYGPYYGPYFGAYYGPGLIYGGPAGGGAGPADDDAGNAPNPDDAAATDVAGAPESDVPQGELFLAGDVCHCPKCRQRYEQFEVLPFG
jgi:hypothetical protein